MSSTTGGQMVTIDRNYFETIVRRANFNPDDLTTSVVSICQSEYDDLKQIAAKYANLQQNLLRGGVDEETIDLLSQNDATIEQQIAPPAPAQAGAAQHPAYPEARPQPSRGTSTKFGIYNPQSKSFARIHTQELHSWPNVDTQEEDEFEPGGGPGGDFHGHGLSEQQASSRPHYERQCSRTIILNNLAEGVTHADITEAVRGGQLLDIYLRPQDRMATVSFLQANDARAFFDHVRRHDIYIKHKRVDVRWNDRQFILPGHVAGKIGIGATRNLVIRRCDPRITEETIREDLEHIHNLVVIKVEFIGGSCHIRTNSVHNAMFARTCMMSRARYKGCKIDWDVDECCQPFKPLSQITARKGYLANSTMKKSNCSSMTNRFHLLDLDDDGDEDDISPALGNKKTIGIAA